MKFNILFSPKRAERHPIEMMLVGIVFSSLSIVLSLWIFPQQASLVMVFFTVLSCIYVIQGAIKMEEAREKRNKGEEWRLRKHSRLLFSLLCLFIGFVISFSFWAFILPADMMNSMFSMQQATVNNIRANITGNIINGSGLFPIIINNLKVLFVSIIFAFFYGAGSIFILAWNASVLGFVIGNLTRNSIGIVGMPVAFLKYFLHGIPEMLAYITAALAGGIIYVALWKGDFLKEDRRKRIIFDVIVLILIAILLLIIAAFIEVYLSPLI